MVVILGLVLLVALSRRTAERSATERARPLSPEAGAADARSPAVEADAGDEDMAIAYGLLLDSPRPKEVVEEGLRIAELLRQRYGIDTGNRYQDRMAAARRAKREFIDRLEFTPQEIEEMAASLGHSLDPKLCADFCAQVHRLAVLELQKDALRAFAEGREGPGTLGE